MTLREGSPVTVTTPFSTTSRSCGTPSLSAASRIRTCRASAAAVRSAGPNIRVVSEPNVPMSQGQRSVSPITISIASRLTPRSSAAIWASEVMTPCPISILPEKTVTRPSSPTRRYALRSEG